MQRPQTFNFTVLAVLFAAIGSGASTAYAQQYPAPGGSPTPAPSLPAPVLSEPPAPPPPGRLTSGLQVSVTPYLWLANVTTAISTPLARAPVIDTSVGAFQLLGHLAAVPFIGSVEFRDGPFSLLGDVIHLPVGTNITTRNVFFNGGSASLTPNIGTAVFLYHAVDQPVQSLDGGVGFRAWGVSSGLTLNGGLLPTTSVNRSSGWGDPLIAARYHRDFGNGFGLTTYGDVGGFGVAAHVDWQVLGTLDYTLKPWVALRLGYRSLNLTASGSEIGYVVHLKGPILGATFRF
jgi:hypothetical protein